MIEKHLLHLKCLYQLLPKEISRGNATEDVCITIFEGSVETS